MTRQGSIVFAIGGILIFLNFWLSGQSTVLWEAIAKPLSGGIGLTSKTTPAPKSAQQPSSTSNAHPGQGTGVY